MPSEPSRISRRVFLQGTAVLAGAMAAGGALPTLHQRLAALAAGKPAPTARNPLYIPPTFFPSGALRAAPATVSTGGIQNLKVWAYNSLFPGPTYRAYRGATAQIELQNGLSQETITHWHGMLVTTRNDGHPKFAIPSGGTYPYNFIINQRAAMNWYHPHPHLLTGEQTAMGLAGAFIVTDTEENALGLPSGDYEVPLIIRDAQIDRTGTMQYKPRSGGFLGDVALVNGTLNPRLDVASARYRLRVLNAANSRIFGLALSNSGVPVTLIGNDGGLLETAVSITRADIAIGERLDLIVDFRGLPVGSTVLLRDLRSGWDLLEFRVTRAGTDTGITPTTLSTIELLTNPVRTRTFTFDGMSRINGKEFDPYRTDFSVPFGQVERWVFSTKGNAPHPVHVHGAPFQVQSRTGGRGQLFPWERGWKDTVLLEDGETVGVLIRFNTFRDIYLIHCHKLEHEDGGMMANFEVV